MKIGVVGAGMSGLAAAYFLAEKGCAVTIFDAKGIGKGASGVAAGLMHPYAGAHSKKNRFADEGMKATTQLLNVASGFLNRQVHSPLGVLRLATTPEQHLNFKYCADTHPDVKWLEAEDCSRLVPDSLPLPGIFIQSGLAIDCPLYLDGLLLACKSLGAEYLVQEIDALDQLASFDHVIIAAGAASMRFKELASFRLSPVKGQVLEIAWPKEVQPLPCPIASQAYLLMQPDGRAIAGATFEHYFDSDAPDLDAACKEIMPKVKAFFPSIGKEDVIGCRAGIRASAPGRLPIATRAGDRLWLLSGMGSKGLLYHALYASELCRQIQQG
jgi:glycine/D-amino acid oxidase-like deaminating enzyme